MRDQRGEKNHFYGKHHTEEAKRKISEARLGTVMSEDTKLKIAKAKLGKTLSEEHKQKIREAKLGKTLTEETKLKMRNAKLGKKYPGRGYKAWITRRKRYGPTGKRPKNPPA